MATFIQVDERAGLLVLLAAVLAVWVYAAPDHATATFVSMKEAFMGVLP